MANVDEDRNPCTGSNPHVIRIEAVLERMRQLEPVLEGRIETLESKCQTQRDLAKQNVKTDKREAMKALRRAKNYEHNQEQSSKMLNTLQLQIDLMERAVIALTSVAALKVAHAAAENLKHSPGALGELDEASQITSELESFLSSLACDPHDQEELEEELEDLLDTTELPELPSPPSNPLPTAGASEKQLKVRHVEGKASLEKMRAWVSHSS